MKNIIASFIPDIQWWVMLEGTLGVLRVSIKVVMMGMVYGLRSAEKFLSNKDNIKAEFSRCPKLPVPMLRKTKKKKDDESQKLVSPSGN